MYRVTVGLEIHAELATKTKMFCACLNDADEKTPNKNICPVCMSHPGTLPVINKEAVHKVLQVGTATGSTLADYSEFDRKNYFYPDIPKGYQISQYQFPLISGGKLAGVELTRIHLEEDTARSQHEVDKSLVDFNRAGVPLMELVTEPVIHDSGTAGAFARELQLLLRYLGAGEANMEKGEMRVEANISVSLDDTLGTRVEVKNLNSIRSMERAIDYEVKRQSGLLEKGGKVEQETRGWDEQKQATFLQRKKESSHDYRYFPDPDLPKLKISEIPEFSREVLSKEISGKLPWEKRERYVGYGATAEAAEILVQDQVRADIFEKVVQESKDEKNIKASLNFITQSPYDIQKVQPSSVVSLSTMFVEGVISSTAAKTVFQILSEGIEIDPKVIAEEKGLLQQSGGDYIDGVVGKVIENNPTVVADYKAGKQAALQFLLGQGMKESKGSANPEALKQTLLKNLG